MFCLLLLSCMAVALPLGLSTLPASPPYFVTYVDAFNSWWPPTAIAAGLGVPSYAPASSYNVVNLAFWLSTGPVDAALVWSDALKYCSDDNPWGTTTQQIQAAWLDLYHAQNISVFVSAFGATEWPTSAGLDPTATANSLASFVLENQFDGVDIDYEDNTAMDGGTAEQWLITFNDALRAALPASIQISHAPQSPWFSKEAYPAGAYLTVDQQTGKNIDFYNIQFYNQGDSDYLTYDTLFVEADGWATGTAVFQLEQSGIPLSKVVVGKPVTTGDATNTGYVAVDQLESMLSEGITQGWQTGFMGWQYISDISKTSNTWSNTLSQAWNGSTSPLVKAALLS